jgi:hypothetical protein
MSRNVCLHADACCGLPAAIQSNRRNPLKWMGQSVCLVRNCVWNSRTTSYTCWRDSTRSWRAPGTENGANAKHAEALSNNIRISFLIASVPDSFLFSFFSSHSFSGEARFEGFLRLGHLEAQVRSCAFGLRRCFEVLRYAVASSVHKVVGDSGASSRCSGILEA